ncbi:MAG: hypothetical protein P4L69_20485 [Desulfosporosinus sp.]|nr:hypothetical protein [Desulfosporosinus sp.]
MTKGYKTRYKAKLPDRDVGMFVAMYQLQVVSEDDLVAIFHEGRGLATAVKCKLKDICASFMAK